MAFSQEPGTRAVLTDVMGQAITAPCVLSGNHTFSLSGIAPGIYQLLLTDAQGRRSIARVVKEN